MADLHRISPSFSPERHLDVVFVHGLGGDPFTTWRSSDDEASFSWPHWLAQTYEERIGVWSLGYATANPLQQTRLNVPLLSKDAPVAGVAMPLPRRAKNVLERLTQEGIGERPVCFITHSLGGLLVKSVLRLATESIHTPRWQRVAEQCRGVMFLATPHHGSALADLVNLFRIVLPTVNTDDLRDNDPHLMQLSQWYRDHAPRQKIQTYSYYETKPYKNLIIVIESSADPGVSGPLAKPTIPVERDHLEICKPCDHNDLVCFGSIELIEGILQGASSPSVAREPSAAPVSAQQTNAPTPASSLVVRSFLPDGVENAETLIDLTDLFICADSRDRRPKHPEVWTQELPGRLRDAAATIERLPRPVALATHTHLSIAWYLGTLLSPKRGIPLLLRQRAANASDQLWDCGEPKLPAGGADWLFERFNLGAGPDLALVVSPTHVALQQARHSIGLLGLPVGEIHHARLASPGRASIQDGGHARWLADALITTLHAAVVRLRPGRLHLFAACPVSLAFLLGQQAELLGPTTAYEFAMGTADPVYFPGMATGL